MTYIKEKIRIFLQNCPNEQRILGKSDPFWVSLEATGTEIWLDTGNVFDDEVNRTG
jgi:hypothetical protein